jgi:DeoR family suf operon transcriptional repressor
VTVAAHPALATLPPTRRAVLEHLKRHGEETVEALAAGVAITVSGMRQHLTALERDGLVVYRSERTGPGRPKHRYRLTPTASALFPRAYAELTNELLTYLADEDPDVVERVFARRGARRVADARRRTAGRDLGGKVAELTAILDEDGYLAEFEARGDGSYVIVEHNCAIHGVALRYAAACRSELAFLQEVLDEAVVRRTFHMMAGAHVCAYEVVPR